MNFESEANESQDSYYARTASSYDASHLHSGDAHFKALEHVAAIAASLGAQSILDVGSGTGRAVRFLRSRCPEMRLVGVEPSDELRSEASSKVDAEFFGGAGESLEFEDNSFDVVIATAVMHHVPDPSAVISEMQRVARFGVMISDSNRFGQSGVLSGAVKATLLLTRLWKPITTLRTGGRGYFESEGDGVFYSYSIYDSVEQMAMWGDTSFVIPTDGSRPRGLTGSLFTASSGLLVGLRESKVEGWGALSD